MQKLMQDFITFYDCDTYLLQEDFDLQHLYILVNNKTFFKNKILVKIIGLTNFSPEIKDLILNIQAHSNLVFFMQYSNFNTKDIDFFIQHESLLAVESSRNTKFVLKKEIEHFLNSHKLIYDETCLSFLVNYFKNKDSFFVQYNLERLVDYFTLNSRLSLSHIQNLFLDSTEFQLDKIFFAICDLKVLPIYTNSLVEGEHMILIKYFIKNYYLLYLILLYKSSELYSIEHFVKKFKMKIYPSHFSKLLTISAKYSLQKIFKIFSVLNKAELKIKKDKITVNLFLDVFFPIHNIVDGRQY